MKSKHAEAKTPETLAKLKAMDDSEGKFELRGGA